MNVSDYLMVKTASVRKQAGFRQLEKMYKAMAKDPIAAAKAIGMNPTASELAELTPELKAEFHDIFTTKAQKMNNAHDATNKLYNPYHVRIAEDAIREEQGIFGDKFKEPHHSFMQRNQNYRINRAIKQDNKDFSKAFNNVDAMINKGYKPEQLNKSIDMLYPEEKLMEYKSVNNSDNFSINNRDLFTKHSEDEARNIIGVRQNEAGRENKILSHIQNKKAELKAKVNKRYNELNN